MPTCMFSLMKHLIRYFDYCFSFFSSVLFVIFFVSSLHILAANPLSDICIVNILSLTVACLSIFLTVCLEEQKF